MRSPLVLAAAFALIAFGAQATGPVHSPGSTTPAPKSTPLHCDENATGAKGTHRHCDCDPKKPARVPADLSEMIEEHFLSVQAESQVTAL